MSITITESYRGRGRSRTTDQRDTGTRVFQVVGATDVGNFTADEAAMDAVAAQFGVFVNAAWPSVDVLVCQSVTPAYVSKNFITVVAQYGVPSTGSYQPTGSPLLLPWRYEWRDCTEEEAFDRDVDNNVVVNSGGFPPSPPPTKSITKEVLLIRRNEAYYNRSVYKLYKNTVNSDAVTLIEPNGNSNTFPAGTMKCVSIAPDAAYCAGDTVVPMVLTFEVYDLSQINITEPFQLHLLDEGYSGWRMPSSSTENGGNALWAAFVNQDSSGEFAPVPQQVLLDGTGKPLLPPSASGTPVYVGKGDNPVANPAVSNHGATIERALNNAAVYLRWTRYKKVPFLPILTQPAGG